MISLNTEEKTDPVGRQLDDLVDRLGRLAKLETVSPVEVLAIMLKIARLRNEWLSSREG